MSDDWKLGLEDCELFIEPRDPWEDFKTAMGPDGREMCERNEQLDKALPQMERASAADSDSDYP